MRIEYTLKLKATNNFGVCHIDTMTLNNGMIEITWKINESNRSFEDYAKKSELEGLIEDTKGEYLLEIVYCPKDGYIGAWAETHAGEKWDTNE